MIENFPWNGGTAAMREINGLQSLPVKLIFFLQAGKWTSLLEQVCSHCCSSSISLAILLRVSINTYNIPFLRSVQMKGSF